MRQKFKAGEFVRVSKTMPETMRHFEKGFVGCIEGSYNDRYRHGDSKIYSVIQFKRGRAVNLIAWYPEELLDRLDGESLVAYFRKEIR